jgi:hypothetical protein
VVARCRNARPAVTVSVVVAYRPLENGIAMFQTVRRIYHAVADLAPEDRPAFKRIDASPAKPDDGAWLRQGR